MLKIEVSFKWEHDPSLWDTLYQQTPETVAYLNSPQFERYYRDYMALGKRKDYVISVLKTVPTLHVIDHNWNVFRGRPYNITHLKLACNHPQELRSALERIMEHIGAIGSVTMRWQDKSWECYTHKSINGFEKTIK